ncbi:MAG: carbamoyltransferase [Pirellulaceae bacterium]
MAYEVQNECEEAYLHLVRYAHEKTGEDRLCLSGGVALNSVANYKVLRSGVFQEIFINPAASDTGIPLGAALYGFHHLLEQPKNYDTISPYVGPAYNTERVVSAIDSFEGYRVVEEDAQIEAARWLAANKIVGHFSSRSEMGPRALGNRSILMSPLVAENKDVLNARVKFREEFRPFAPVVLEERREEYFVLDRPSPYMLLVADIRQEKRAEIPAVTHVDGTGRVQTVSREFNPPFYTLIERFCQATGTPVILNTSFNVAGEPIVESPEDAIRCFLSTDIDALLIEDRLLVKDGRSI